MSTDSLSSWRVTGARTSGTLRNSSLHDKAGDKEQHKNDPHDPWGEHPHDPPIDPHQDPHDDYFPKQSASDIMGDTSDAMPEVERTIRALPSVQQELLRTLAKQDALAYEKIIEAAVEEKPAEPDTVRRVEAVLGTDQSRHLVSERGEIDASLADSLVAIAALLTTTIAVSATAGVMAAAAGPVAAVALAVGTTLGVVAHIAKEMDERNDIEPEPEQKMDRGGGRTRSHRREQSGGGRGM